MLFFRRKRKDLDAEDKQITLMDQESKVEENVSLLRQEKDEGSVKKLNSDVNNTIKRATKDDLKELKLLEKGRCPECGWRTEQFLYTSICSHCGWSKRITPDVGKVIIHLDDKRKIECDKAFEVNDGIILCLQDDVITHEIMRKTLAYIEYVWTEEELGKIRRKRTEELHPLCNWCFKPIQDPDKMVTHYIAFGLDQERFSFCSEDCAVSFEKQYPARVHRNCYERDCNDCDSCRKKYDTSKEKVHIPGQV